MIGRRKSPDGLPFRLYQHDGVRTVSFGYKDVSGKWVFRYSAPRARPDLVADARRRAIDEANRLNGDTVPETGTVTALINRYFDWQDGMPRDSEMRKAESTLIENRRERKWLDKVFGKMHPTAIKTHHVYAYLDRRGKQAPAKANKEIALLSAVLEYGRRVGELANNPCSGIQYNRTKPRTRTVSRHDQAYVLREARRRGGSYLVQALGMRAAYLTVNRPEELRTLHRNAITPHGVEVAIGKRKGGQAQRTKLVEWSPRLRLIINLALKLQRTSSMYVFANQAGQPYTRSGWSSNWRRLMVYCEKRAAEEGVKFQRFSLADMRPTAVTKRVEEGDARILDATGHADGRMVAKVYDRRAVKKVRSTE